MNTHKLIEIIVSNITALNTPEETHMGLITELNIDIPMQLINDVFELVNGDVKVLKSYFEDIWDTEIDSHVFDKIYELYDTDLIMIGDRYKMNISFDVNL